MKKYTKFICLLILVIFNTTLYAVEDSKETDIDKKIKNVKKELSDYLNNEEEKIQKTRKELKLDNSEFDYRVLVIKTANAKKKLSDYLNNEEEKIQKTRKELKLDNSGFDYRVFTPSLRTFFDRGTDDPGEIDLYDNGTLGLSLNFVSLDYMWVFEKVNVGPSVSLGLSSASGSGTDDSAIFFWGFGLRTTLKSSTNVPVSFEIGYMQGISADEGLDSTQRDDSAIYVSIDIPIINK